MSPAFTNENKLENMKGRLEIGLAICLQLLQNMNVVMADVHFEMYSYLKCPYKLFNPFTGIIQSLQNLLMQLLCIHV